MRDWYEEMEVDDEIKKQVEEIVEPFMEKLKEDLEERFPRDMKLPEKDEDVVD